MKKNDPLRRLFRSAASAPQICCVEPPFGFESRVLAQARRARIQDDSLWIALFFKRAFVAACLVTLLSVVLGYHSFRESGQNELTLTDSVIKMSLLP